jgi:hypothetical protein
MEELNALNGGGYCIQRDAEQQIIDIPQLNAIIRC